MSPLQSFVLHPLAQTLGWTLLHFLWQGAALGLLAWLALVLLRRASARARYGMACAFLVLMVAAPVGTFLTLQPQLRAPVPAGAVALTRDAAAAEPTAVAAPPLAQRVKASLDPSLPWLLAGWAAGVLLLSARFLGSWLRVQRLRRRSATSVPAEWHLVVSRLCRELRLARTVRLLQSAAVEVPTALGWLRPVILLPACALTGLAPVQLEAILAHELAHIRRGDFVVNLLQSLVEVLLFYHPAVWWLSARIRAERELCCDDVAAGLCGDPLILARALTDLEALRQPLTPAPTRLALAANGGSLMHRVRHLLHPALPITSGARATALAVLAASLLGAAGVALQDKEVAPRAPKSPKVRGVEEEVQRTLTMKGEVKLNPEAPDPVTVPGEGSFQVKERKGGQTRTCLITREKTTYTVDGQEQALDAQAKDWLREVARVAAKAQVGRERGRKLKLQVDLDHAQGGGGKAPAGDLHDGERRIEIHTRHLRDGDDQADAHARELEHHLQGLAPEERARVQADLEKARAEGRKLRVKVIEQRGEAPGTVIIQKDGEPRNVTVKRFKIKQDGAPGDGHEWSVIESGDKDVWVEGMDPDIHIPEIHIPDIHIPRMRVHPSAHPGGEDRQLELAELQAELKALQARLNQLQKELATAPKPPRPPKPPKAPATPRGTQPAPPPPPPAPLAPPAPAAPPAPPAPPAPSSSAQ